jgi:hypothetical protein
MTASAVGTGWRVLGASVEGTSHLGGDLGCQDAHAVVQEAGWLIVAVADGAGSAPRAAEGAALAVRAVVEHGRGRILDPDAGDLDAGDVDAAGLAADCIGAARLALEDLAGDDELGDLATTLLVVVGRGAQLGLAQVGDGAVVVDSGGASRVVGAVDRGEYLNETVFVTSSGWEDARRVDVVEAQVDGIAVMSDGLQLLALDLATMEAHEPFFRPLWDFARRAEATSDELAAFLASERVCARTDDDKTLVLAVVDAAAGAADVE